MQRQKTEWNPAAGLSEQAPGVYFAVGPASNWIVVRDGTGFIIIDSGYPGDRGHVLACLRHLGLEPADARALLLTHGHVDHTGSAAYFSESFGTPVLCAPEEVAHVRGSEKHQVTLGQVLARAWRPRVFRWMVHAIRAGALAAKPVPRAEAWDAARLRDLPGSPEAVLLPGHTPGNAAILLPSAGAIAVGDSFVSGHPLSRTTGPQMLHPMYHSDPAGGAGRTGQPCRHGSGGHPAGPWPGAPHCPARRGRGGPDLACALSGLFMPEQAGRPGVQDGQNLP